eukprot:1586784-Rhodomonas_salina.3
MSTRRQLEAGHSPRHVTSTVTRFSNGVSVKRRQKDRKRPNLFKTNLEIIVREDPTSKFNLAGTEPSAQQRLLCKGKGLNARGYPRDVLARCGHHFCSECLLERGSRASPHEYQREEPGCGQRVASLFVATLEMVMNPSSPSALGAARFGFRKRDLSKQRGRANQAGI